MEGAKGLRWPKFCFHESNPNSSSAPTWARGGLCVAFLGNQKQAMRFLLCQEWISLIFIWLVVSIPLKKILVSWDDYSQCIYNIYIYIRTYIRTYMEKEKLFQTTNQSCSLTKDPKVIHRFHAFAGARWRNHVSSAGPRDKCFLSKLCKQHCLMCSWPAKKNTFAIHLQEFVWLVVAVSTPLKNMKVNWNSYSQYIYIYMYMI